MDQIKACQAEFTSVVFVVSDAHTLTTSVLLLAFYLVLKHHWTLKVALEYVQSCTDGAKLLTEGTGEILGRFECSLFAKHFQFERIRLDTLHTGTLISSATTSDTKAVNLTDEQTLVNTVVNKQLRGTPLTDSETMDIYTAMKPAHNWQRHYKRVSWVDQRTKEDLTEVCLIFDNSCVDQKPKKSQ